ncbi:hypothetical protein ANANG_G00176630 [Anguilla anguilla]|uniref:Uncharacterized protein n=1 Tax=Anguilla anguilla TaxID=7936 RepID=A0A9D3M4G7_ANGAN|nr:hypothetical protein ANANG_G00176630 [Anguilla anguilla]
MVWHPKSSRFTRSPAHHSHSLKTMELWSSTASIRGLRWLNNGRRMGNAFHLFSWQEAANHPGLCSTADLLQGREL